MMNGSRIIALDVESCSVKSKYPTYADFILGISVHSTSSMNPQSTYNNRQFIIQDLTYEAEEEVIKQFLEYLSIEQGAILTAYNLFGFDHPLLLNRSREHYPLGFKLLDVIPSFSLYDTMIAYKAYTQRLRSCKLIAALTELKANGCECFLLDHKNLSSGKDSLSLWAKQRFGFSDEFSTYISDDSYNHMRLAQILLQSDIKHGLWLVP